MRRTVSTSLMGNAFSLSNTDDYLSVRSKLQRVSVCSATQEVKADAESLLDWADEIPEILAWRNADLVDINRKAVQNSAQ
ncbi:hypothetical protein VTP01DRAFT_4277, partial [Rhizomucor pusillus]|uniref:uncharacterized protein n=1 Tax=Rhizomucor pusillus TaxID=4840 RepID=UPI0037431C1C